MVVLVDWFLIEILVWFVFGDCLLIVLGVYFDWLFFILLVMYFGVFILRRVFGDLCG